MSDDNLKYKLYAGEEGTLIFFDNIKGLFAALPDILC
jgi:hypothetical protein